METQLHTSDQHAMPALHESAVDGVDPFAHHGDLVTMYAGAIASGDAELAHALAAKVNEHVTTLPSDGMDPETAQSVYGVDPWQHAAHLKRIDRARPKL